MNDQKTKDAAYYVAEWGGAAGDVAYKDPGGLTITGPFEDSEGARDFIPAIAPEVFDTPVGFRVLVGRIDGVGLSSPEGVVSPRDRLFENLESLEDSFGAPSPDDDIRAGIREAELVQLDRWRPGWEAELRKGLAA